MTNGTRYRVRCSSGDFEEFEVIRWFSALRSRATKISLTHFVRLTFPSQRPIRVR
jgi:hypothetical protein